MAIVPAIEDRIADAATALRRGSLVAFPTETVYGLGADATNGLAIAALYAAKGRPSFNPLIVHVTQMEAVATLAHVTPAADRLAAAFWPGPLTMVLEKRPTRIIVDLATAGLDTIAIRIPSHPVAQALLKATNLPIAAPSANRSGLVSPTTAAHVDADLGGRVAMILDGGPAPLGLESTVVDATGAEPVVLRLGAVAREDLSRALGRSIAVASGDPAKPTSPGMLARHYAPRARLRHDARDVHGGEALLAFGAPVPQHDGPMINLSASGDLIEAAANLFAALRALDAAGAEAIAVMPIPEHGLGEAINDRLRRAAKAS